MTNDEVERAIEFLLKNQANFDSRLEQTNQQIEQTNQQIAETIRRLDFHAGTQSEFMQTVLGNIEFQTKQNAEFRQEIRELAQARVQQDETNAEFRQVIRELAQARIKQDEINAKQSETNIDLRQTLNELAQAQRQVQQEISELTRNVNSLVNFSSGNGNAGQE